MSILERFSFNHATAKFWDQREAVEACARTGSGIGLWREPVQQMGLEASAKLQRLDPTELNGTDRMRLYVFGTPGQGQVNLVALLDNLGKGASGAAVQNIRLMLGLA